MDGMNGILERMGLIFNQYTPFNVQVNLHYEGKLDLEAFRKALCDTQKKYPYLNYYLDCDGNMKRFEDIVQIPIEIVKCEVFEEWLDKANDDVNVKFVGSMSPLVRVRIYTDDNQNCMSITMPHFICDGISLSSLIHEIMNQYSLNLSGQCIQITEEEPYFSVSYNDILKYLDDDYSIFAYDNSIESILSEPVPYLERKHAMTVFEVEKMDTLKLLKKCKEQECSTQACLSALAGIALGKVIKNTYPEREVIKVDNLTAIDIRRLMGQSVNKQLGFGAMFAKTSQSIIGKNNNVIELTKSAGLALKQFIQKNGCFKILQVIQSRFGLSNEEFMESMQFREPYVFISNVGNVDFNSKSSSMNGLVFTKLYGTANTLNTQSTKWGISLTVVTLDDVMYLTMGYMANIWTKEMVDDFIKEFMLELKQFAFD